MLNPSPQAPENVAFPFIIDGKSLVIHATDKAEAERLAGELLAERKREQDRRSKWPLTPAGAIDTGKAMVALARRFPSLADGAPGIEPWDALAVLRWAVLGGQSHGEVLAAKFMLGVWNNTDWQRLANADPELLAEYRRLVENPKAQIVFSRFSVFEAMEVWDNAHREAMLYWLSAPFYP
jgi:hypothetical protein